MLGLLSIAFPFSRRLRGGSSDYLGKGRPPALRDAAESPHDATGSSVPSAFTGRPQRCSQGPQSWWLPAPPSHRLLIRSALLVQTFFKPVASHVRVTWHARDRDARTRARSPRYPSRRPQSLSCAALNPHTAGSVEAGGLILEAHRRGLEAVDDQGLRPLHLLCSSRAHNEHTVLPARCG